ncbi:hypothetical protein GCM10022254_32750 [Actinomadura meridiana]|uniref:HTH gntR-type domain-containing protein n=2 Tax=Actinomadura meridiana TaxID=559626 RepID=A0ABP8C2R6_9ACTN
MTGPAKEAQAGGKLYEIVRDELIEAIKSGVYAPGALLPSVREITVTWTVSTTTARKVVSELAASGWARSQGTKGYVAAIPDQGESTRTSEDQGAAMPQPIAGLSAARVPQVVTANGSLEVVTSACEVRSEPVPVEVAHALHATDPHARAIVRRSVAVDANGSPVQLRVSYTACEVGEGTPLETSDAIDKPWSKALSEHTGRRLTLAESAISARHPSDAEGAMLGLTPTACVLVRIDVTQDEDGQPIDYTMTVWPGETTRVDVLSLARNK